jgi:hypothetical protein
MPPTKHGLATFLSSTHYQAASPSKMVNRTLLKWKTRFAASPTVAWDIAELKNSDERLLKESLIPHLLAKKKTKAIIAPSPFPTSLGDINFKVRIPSSSLTKEIWWASRLLSHFAPQINVFLSAKRSIETDIRLGDFSNAELQLTSLESTLGVSLWSHELRIYLTGMIGGLEAQKEFSLSIKNSDVSEILKCFTHYISIRCEPRVSWWKYEDYLSSLLSSVSDASSADTFFGLLLNPLRFQFRKSPAEILSIFSAHSVVDFYEAFVRILQKLVTYDSPLNAAGYCLTYMLASGIADARLALLCSVLGVEHPTPTGVNVSILDHALTLYTAGSYPDCCAFCWEQLPLNPNIFQLYELCAKSHARIGETPSAMTGIAEIDSLVSDLVNISLKTPSADRAASRITKKAYTLSGSEFSAQLFSFLVRDYITDGLEDNPEIAFGFLNGSYYNPKNLILLIPDSAREGYLRSLKVLAPSSATLAFFESIAGGVQNIGQATWVASERRDFYRGYKLSCNKDYAAAEAILRSLSASEDRVLQQDATLKLNQILQEQGKLGESLDLLAETFAANPSILSRLPLERLLTAIDSSDQLFDDHISLPILRELASRNGNPSLIQKRDDSYEDFLQSHNTSKPSELAALENQFSRALLVLFLSEVCTPQVMDNSIAFDSTESLLTERIAICRFLINLDPPQIDEYSDEIKRITQHLIVQRGLREVEQSKIYVDVAGISRSVEKSLKESYARYNDLLASRVSTEQNDIILKFSELFGDQMVVLVPNDELRPLLIEMVLEMRDQFVSSNEYGLDGYLSTGLRHGTLAGQIRAPFETEHLVTQRDEDSLVYRPPNHWLELLGFTGVVAEELSRLLQDFSREIDDLIDRVRTDWIQIRTEKRETKGLFDYRLGQAHLIPLESKIKIGTSYEEFTSIVFEMLWQITERNLKQVREMIDLDLKPKLLSMIDGLSSRISAIHADTSLLKTSITSAKTNAQYAIDKIASWFMRAKASSIGPCEFDLPIEIALAMIKNVFPSFQLECNPEVAAANKLKGESLTGLVNVFYLLLDNTRKHCGGVEAPVKVAANLTLESDLISIAMNNSLRSELTLDEARRRLEESLNREDGSFDYVRKEGGSGLHKIKKILIVELGLDPAMSFSIDDSRQFTANISFNASPILA